MTKIQDVIRAAIPNADQAECEFILWERTSYPFGLLTAKDIYKAAYSFDRACKNHLRLCEYCDRIAQPDKYMCSKCEEALRR